MGFQFEQSSSSFLPGFIRHLIISLTLMNTSKPIIRIATVAILAFTLLPSVVTTAQAQAPAAAAPAPAATNPAQYNLDKLKIAIQGHDPVTYFTQGKAVKGQAGIGHIHDGVKYFFSSADTLDGAGGTATSAGGAA